MELYGLGVETVATIKRTMDSLGQDKYELSYLQLNLSRDIRDKFRIWDGNKELMDSCREAAGSDNITEDDASAMIVEELWKRLKDSHGLRVVK